jgi:hypothetical protein
VLPGAFPLLEELRLDVLEKLRLQSGKSVG